VALDDDQDTRELIAATLRRLDADVVSAASVVEALAAVETHRPDVVLVDIAMPDEDGYAFLRRLRQQKRDADEPQAGRRIPAVAVTAYARDTDRTQALEAGFDAHVSKPLDLDALTRLVHTLTNDVADGDRHRNDSDRQP
jgi:CheY-like chemotaxis protein